MAGEKLKESKKRGKMASAKQSGRDWGRVSEILYVLLSEKTSRN